MRRMNMDASPHTLPPTPATHPWDGFLVGAENELAHASALALARGDGAGLSPLVVHGPSGAGKSRLLSGLIAERLLRRPLPSTGGPWWRKMMVHVDRAATDVELDGGPARRPRSSLAERADAGHEGGGARRRQGLQKRTSISHRFAFRERVTNPIDQCADDRHRGHREHRETPKDHSVCSVRSVACS